MILSASRRTDIPAFYMDWFLRRLGEGWFLIPHPRNPKQYTKCYVSRETVDCIVFWSKNPKPLLERLDKLLALNIPFYVQYTLNPYGTDLEPGLPLPEERLRTFEALSEQLGPTRVVWRYDPVVVNGTYTLGYHAQAFHQLSRRLKGKTHRCILSFLDLYPARMPGAAGLADRVLTREETQQIASFFSADAHCVGMELSTCCEAVDLSGYGITHASCIDQRLIESLVESKLDIKKDAGQRTQCGCVESVDVGSYNTCGHGCVYCYARSRIGKRGLQASQPLPKDAVVIEKHPKSNKTGQTSLF